MKLANGVSMSAATFGDWPLKVIMVESTPEKPKTSERLEPLTNFFDAPRGTCKWPYGDNRCCGRPVIKFRSPYCKHHHGVGNRKPELTGNQLAKNLSKFYR